MCVRKVADMLFGLLAVAAVACIASGRVSAESLPTEGIFCNDADVARYIAHTVRTKSAARIVEAVLTQQGRAGRYSDAPENYLHMKLHAANRLRAHPQWCEWDSRQIYKAEPKAGDGTEPIFASPSDVYMPYWQYYILKSEKAGAHAALIKPLTTRVEALRSGY